MPTESTRESPAADPNQRSYAFMLLLNVFVAGMGIMAIEMTAFRLLAPFFGTTQLIITNIIGTILLALALGNWIGGRLGDRYNTPLGPSWILVASALLVLFIQWTSRGVLTNASEALGREDLFSFGLSLVGSTLLFALPFVLMGMISPYSIRALTTSEEHVGRRAGLVYLTGTLGSILGTYLPTFLFIPLWGSSTTILFFSAIMLLTGLCGLLRGRLKNVPAALGALILFATLAALTRESPLPHDNAIHAEESLYNYIRVNEDKEGRRLLYLNEGHGYHSVHDPRPGRVLVDDVWSAFLALPAMLPKRDARAPLRVLVIGLAAGTISNLYTHYLGDEVEIDGVEIDPAITRVGKEYFALDTSHLTIYHEDGRTFLSREHEPYDIIIADAYKQPYVPFHLATLEFFEACSRQLKENGLLGINVATFSEESPLRDSIEATMSRCFPHLYRIEIGNFDVNFVNNIILASRHAPHKLQLTRHFPQGPVELLTKLEQRIQKIEVSPETPHYTDDWAPVEWTVDLALFNFFESD